MRSSTYPSVYVEFQSIQVTDLCGTVGLDVKMATTIGFDATELSTAASFLVGDSEQRDYTLQPWWTYTAINYLERYL